MKLLPIQVGRNPVIAARPGRRPGAGILPLALLVVSTGLLHAQTPSTTWITVGTGIFGTGANWSSGVPSSGVDAIIINGTLATPTIVNLTGSSAVANLQLGGFDTLNLALGSTLAVSGTQISNAGAINVTAGSASNTVLGFNASLTLSGAGTLTLNSGDNNGAVYVQQLGTGVTLTNSDSTIQGYGIIGNGGLAVVNQATINANATGRNLILNGSGGFTNTGLIEATGGGMLSVATGGSLGNAGGTIQAGTGSTVNLGAGTTISGGTLATASTGVLQSSGTANLAGVTLSTGSTYTGGLSSTTNLSGTITNNGNFQITAGSGNNTVLGLNVNTTLTGGGTVTLNSGDKNGQVFVQQQAGGLTLTNANNTLQGYGVIGNGGLSFVNQGVVNANSAGNVLTLNGGGGLTNTGLIEATGGGVLSISFAGTAANAGGTIQAGTGSTVNLGAGATVSGGTLTSTGTGVLQTSGTANLAGVTLSTGSTYTGGLSSTTNLSGAITNNGNFQINAGSGNNTVLGLNANTTLSGGGTVTLNSGDNNGEAFIQQQSGGVTLTNANNTIQGYGALGNGGLALVNQGTVNANVTNQSLTLNGGGGIANPSGLLEATNGGTLVINTTVNNQGGTILSNGGTVNVIGGFAIQGGTLGGTALGTNRQATLDGSTASGAVTLAPAGIWTGALNSTTYVNGSIANQGTITLNAGGGANTALGLNGNTTLTGGGTVTLNSGDNNGQAIIQQQAGSLTLTNVDNTIQGYGVIGNGGLALVNQGTVNANVLNQSLTLNGGGVANTNLLEATNGGALVINTVVANQTGTIAANGGTVDVIGGSAIQGGTLSGPALETTAAALLDGSTGSGAVTLAASGVWTGALGTQTYVNGSIINQGTIKFAAGSANNTILGLNGNTTLSGGGIIDLNSGDTNGQVYIQQQAGGLTLTNLNNTIQGYGVLGNSGLAFVNQAGVNANVAGRTLTLNGGGGVANAGGLLQASNGGTLAISTTINNQGGTIAANGGFVNVVGTSAIQGGTLGGAGLETTNAAYLDGSTARGAVTLAPGSVWTSGLGTTTDLNGSIVNQGAMNFTAGSATNTVLGLNGNTTLSGGGVVSLNSGDNNGRVSFQQQAAGLTLTNVDNLIHGYGTIGNGGLALVNAAAGIFLADIPGQSLLLNPGGGLTNNGTLEVASGATLQIAANLPNNGSVILGADAAGAGTLTLTGNYVQGPGGMLVDLIGSPYSGQFNVTGSLTLDGILTVGLVSGFTPTIGSTYTLLGYTGSEAGTFSTVIGSGFTMWSVLYNPGQIAVQFNGFQPVPEPAEWLYLIIAIPLILLVPPIRRKVLAR